MVVSGSTLPALPRLGTGGTGDILTGLIAGLLAQFPARSRCSYGCRGLSTWTGRRTRRGALGEKSLIATDLLRYFPQALEACAHLPQRL